MPSIASVAAQLHAEGGPALLPDTCILLDIIRATYRCLGGCVQRASELLGMVTSVPPQCRLILPSLVPGEWNANASIVCDEVRRHLSKIEEQARHFHDACHVLAIPLGFGRPAYAGAGLADRLYDLSKQLLDNALILDPDTGCTTRGVGRVIAKVPPSKQGGEVKDCVIVEECLELTRQLRALGFTRKCVFCTSNLDDYGGPAGGLHPTLATDFAAVGLGFTANLPWAVHEVRT